MVNILVLPGTTLVAREICHSLSLTKEIQLFGAGYDLSAAQEFPYCRFDFLGALDQLDLIDDIEEIVFRHKIDQVIFAHDSWIFHFRNLDFIGKARIMKNTSASIEISSFKSLTYDTLRGIVPTPLVFKSLEDVSDFPVFLKPDRGQGAVGSSKIHSLIELETYVDDKGFFDTEWIVSEHLPGAEFTIDCFSGSNGKLLYSSPRIRISIESGLATETRLIQYPELSTWARLISQKIKIQGAWFFQAKEDSNGSLKLMELGLRIAGGSGVQRLKGVNLSQLNVWQSRGEKIEIIDQHFFPHKYVDSKNLDFDFQQIYVDYDDTLLIGPSLNYSLVEFLEVSREQGIGIVLITRHSGDVAKSLELFNLGHLFSRIIHITTGEPKSKYIDSTVNFLFIDDSFRERKDVWIQFGSQVLVLDESFMMG